MSRFQLSAWSPVVASNDLARYQKGRSIERQSLRDRCVSDKHTSIKGFDMRDG